QGGPFGQSVLHPPDLYTPQSRRLFVCQSDLRAPIPVAFEQGSRQQNALSFPLHSSVPPVTTAFRSSFPFVSLLWSSASGAGPKINFTLKEKLTWQTNHNPSRLSELAVFRPLSGKTTQTKAPSTT